MLNNIKRIASRYFKKLFFYKDAQFQWANTSTVVLQIRPIFAPIMLAEIPFFSYAFLLAAGSALLLGISKAGIKGIAALIVTGLALVYGAKNSTGIMMPLLIGGDILAVSYYQRHVKWVYIKKLLPWMVFGVSLGVLGGNAISEKTFTYSMVVIIIGSTFMMYYWEQQKTQKVPSHWSFSGLMGVLAGFTTMVGNLAGAFANIYFLAMRLPKNEFIGTAAWLFFIINVFKVPFHVLVWETINWSSLKISATLLPFVVLGFVLGVQIVKKIENDNYRKLILLFTALGGVAILFK